MLIPRVNSNDHILGAIGVGRVSLVEYGRYDCGECYESYGIIKDIRRYLGNRLTYIFRPFPACDEKSPSFRAALAAEAAGAQGWFWEMHEYLFENQGQLDDKHLRSYASKLKLDLRRFGKEMSSGKYIGKVKELLNTGVLSNVKRMPALFINGRLFKGRLDLDDLLCSIEDIGCQVENTLNGTILQT